ncbi:MAG: hypothetical protein FJ386_03510 [Verrucomicrobia bacterium]|nr:hypothetical protein [Verrucomicrobiota bacterium]
MHKNLDIDAVLDDLVAKDPRFRRDAYHFIRDALDHTQRSLLKSQKSQPRHVSGQELLEGIRQFALEQFGPMARVVFDEWGVQRCEDFGDLVFNMIEANLLGKTDKDSREDFKGGYDFFDAFEKPFLPEGTANPRAEPEAKAP